MQNQILNSITLKPNIMKKPIFMLMALGLFTFASCESSTENQMENDAERVEGSAEEVGEEMEEGTEEAGEEIEEGAEEINN